MTLILPRPPCAPMSPENIVLAPCQHGGYSNSPSCIACHGAGHVKVLAGPGGVPTPCKHGGYSNSPQCAACHGSGWAGMV